MFYLEADNTSDRARRSASAAREVYIWVKLQPTSTILKGRLN